MGETSTGPGALCTDALPVHPRTHLRAVGIVGGRPVWPILGGSGEGGQPSGGGAGSSGDGAQGSGDGGQGGTGGQPGNTGQQGTGVGQPTGQPNAGGTGDGGKPSGGDELEKLSPAELAKLVRDLRAENGKDRTTAKQKAADEARQQLAQDIGKALGLVKDDGDKPDPDKLAAMLTAERRERAAEKAARAKNADVDALLDSRSFARQLDALDPAAADFTAKLDQLVDDTLRANPQYLAKPTGPARSGGDHPGGGTPPPATPKSLAAAVRKHYGN